MMMRSRTTDFVSRLAAGLLMVTPLAANAADDDLPTACAREAREDAAELRADVADNRIAQFETLTLAPRIAKPIIIVGVAQRRSEDGTSTATTPFSFSVKWPAGLKVGLSGDGYRYRRTLDAGANDGFTDLRLNASGQQTEALSWKASIKVPTAGAVGSTSASQKVGGTFSRALGERWTASVYAELARTNTTTAERSRFTRTALAELTRAVPGLTSWTASVTHSVRRGVDDTIDVALEHVHKVTPAGWEVVVALNRSVAGPSRDAEVGLRVNRRLH
jgi:hypothetical protein